jgi:hypothetical protein
MVFIIQEISASHSDVVKYPPACFHGDKPVPSARFFQAARIFIWAVLLASLTACGQILPTASPTPAASPTPTALPAPTQTPLPSPTATPTPPLVVLLASSQVDAGLLETYQTEVAALVAPMDMQIQVLPALSAVTLNANLRLVIALPPDPGVAAAIASAPQVPFLAVDIPGLQPAANLVVVSGSGAPPDQQGFIAGAAAAILTTDWRVGAITLADDEAGKAALQGFLNGVTYFCGLCRPAYPPFYEYPLYVELPASSTSTEKQVAAKYLVDHNAETVYVYPPAGDDATLAYLAQAGVKIIGGQQPPEGARSGWVVSFRADPHTQAMALIPELLQGRTSAAPPVSLAMMDANPDLLSPGKQQLIEAILMDLNGGFIDTGVQSQSP